MSIIDRESARKSCFGSAEPTQRQRRYATGLCIYKVNGDAREGTRGYQKRLEKGQLHRLCIRNRRSGVAKLWRNTKKIELSASELSLFLEGCLLVGSQKLSPDRVSFS